MSTPHWKVVTQKNSQWPAIQAATADAPFVVFADETAIGQRGAMKWADLVCRWMNEQMRLGGRWKKPQQADAAFLSAQLTALQLRVRELETENHLLTKHLKQARSSCERARDALVSGMNTPVRY